MKLTDLITSVATGRLSQTKLWSNVGNAIGTAAFAWKVYQGTDSPELWLIYLGAVGSVAMASKAIAMKYGAAKENQG